MAGNMAKPLQDGWIGSNLARYILPLLPAALLALAAAAPGAAEPAKRSVSASLPRLALTIEKVESLPAATRTSTAHGTARQHDRSISLPPPKSELVAGGIRARLKFPGAGKRFSAGTPAFAEITLLNQTGAKSASTEILLETDVAEINFVSGKQIETSEVEGRRRIKVKGLRKGKPRKIFVELVLRDRNGGDAPETPAANTLRVTLRPPGTPDAAASTQASWRVADCAAGFYAQIVAIRELNSPRIGPALKSAWRRDRQRPGRWLFRPPVSGSATKRVCSRWRRYWDPRRGRYRHRCTRYRIVRRGGATGAKVSKEERRTYNFAAKWVRSRAIDPQLSTKQNYGWVSQKVATDLRGYLKQDKHPAICTGVPDFVGYYLKRMSDFHKRTEMFSAKAAKAREQAAAKIAEAHEAVRADPGGHPGWGALPLSIAAPEAPRTLQEAIAKLVELSGDDGTLEEIKRAPSTFSALKTVKQYVSKTGMKDLATPARNAILHALSLIEAADYIDAVAHHYAELDETIVGSLEAVQKAHGEHCTCAK